MRNIIFLRGRNYDEEQKNGIIVALSVMLCCVLILLSGCKWNSKGVMKEVESKLQEKYNETFSTYALGDRIDTNHTRLQCYPTNDESILFEVIYTDDGELKDDYVERKCECELEEELISKFKEVDIQSVCRIAIYTSKRDNAKEKLYASADKYIKDVEPEELYINIGVNAEDIKSKEDVEKLLGVLDEFSNKYNSLKLLVPLYFYESGQYSEIKEFFYKAEYINDYVDKFTTNSDKTKREIVVKINDEDDISGNDSISILEAAKVY